MENDIVCLHAVVEGRVQGVGFRYFVQEKAKALSLTGWVRNTDDDKVEVTAEGPRGQLALLVKALQSGPQMSYVTNVEETWLPASGQYTYFTVTF